MKSTPTLLMKELKFIVEEVERLHREDLERSVVPVNDDLSFKFDNSYDYEINRKKINELYKREREIKSILAKFNANTKIESLDLTIAEALVNISQLQKEIKILRTLACRAEYTTSTSHFSNEKPTINKVNYDLNNAKTELDILRKKLSSIQIAVDRINLTTIIDY